VGVGQRQP